MMRRWPSAQAIARLRGVDWPLYRERYGSRSGERGGEAGEDAEVGVKLNLREPTDAERLQAPLVLEPAELPLHRSASSVEVAPPLRLARDQRVQAVGLDPAGSGLALAGSAAPLGLPALKVRACERPVVMLAGGRAMLAALYGGGLAERDDRRAAALGASLVDRANAIAHVAVPQEASGSLYVLALRAVLRQESLAVGISREVARVYR